MTRTSYGASVSAAMFWWMRLPTAAKTFSPSGIAFCPLTPISRTPSYSRE
jgi:hypothetical protein